MLQKADSISKTPYSQFYAKASAFTIINFHIEKATNY